MAGRRRYSESPQKKRSALVQMILHGEDEEPPQQFNIVQEYQKLRQELLARVQQPSSQGTTRSKNKRPARELSPPKMLSRKKKETRQKISRPYTEMMQRRIEYRRKLLVYLTEGGTEDEDENTKAERRERRYRRYIQHGIGTEHIAPLQQCSINHILALLPSKLKKNFKELLQSLLAEVQQEFVVGVKVAVVEYVLHDSRQQNDSEPDTFASLTVKQRTDQAVAARARKQKLLKTRLFAKKNLHLINKCIAQVLDLWHKSFSDLRLINIQQLSELEHALELPAFKNLIAHQIHAAVQNLKNNWFPALEAIFLQGVKRRLLPTTTRHLTSLFECVAAVMTSQIQQLSIASIQDFTDFICDTKSGNNKGFILEVAYRNKLIVFDPSFSMFRQELLHVLEMLRDAVKHVPRLDTALINKMPAPLTQLPDDKLFLKPVVPTELLAEAQVKLIVTLEEQRILPELRIQDFDAYISLINGEWQDEVDRFLTSRGQHGYEEQVMRVTQLHDLSQSIPCDASFVVGAGLFEVHRGPLVIALVQAAITLRDLLLASMRTDHLALSTQLSEEYESIASRALSPPANTAELMALRAYVAQVEDSTVIELEDRLRQLCQSMLFLVDHTTVTPAEVKQNASPFQWYAKMPDVFAQHQDIVQKKTAEYQQALRVRTQQFVEALALQEKQVTELQHLGDITELPRYLQRARTLQSRLHAALKDIEEFNAQEKAFGWETSQYPLREEVAEQLCPYLELYETSSGFINKHEQWMGSQVGLYHPAEIEAEVETFWQTVDQLEKTFAEVNTVKLLILKVRQRIEEFRDSLPVVQTLGNPDMKERHWEKVSEFVGFPMKADENLTLAKIIDFGLGDYNNKFQVISESATKENNLEKALNQMVAEWAEMEFSVVPYRESGTHNLSSIDDIQLLLDDHIVKTQTMRGSPYIKPFEKDIIEWEANLMLLQEILDSWIKVQGTWMYLEPIFSSPDIQAQMPEEGRRFGAVDKMWRDIMKVVLLDLRVLVVAKIDKMLERLHKSSDLLDAIQRGLNDYLDKKRIFFPRFFFLSNDELLEILSETKDPTRVQPNLKKCFRGVAQLSFTEDMAVASIFSAYGEQVPLCEVIDTASARGQVEQWLKQLESAIKACVLKMMVDSEQTYSSSNLLEWIMAWPSQAVLCMSQVQWTKRVEKALADNTIASLLPELETEANELSVLLGKKLTLQHRTMLGSLILQDIHSKEITSTLMNKKVNDFEWQSQLRSYWQGGNVQIKMLNAAVDYGYEYLGDCVRLVMTPQTVKCFQTIFGALHLNLGAVLQGPTSSGKTETVKDIANVVAKQCVTINCSNGLDCISLGKIFKGVASSGTWICLDELDRLNLETLSAISHQIHSIQRGVRSKAEFILLEGTNVKLDPTCVVLATLTPGPNKSDKLPSNLRSLLRPLAMNVPDFKIISEIVLHCNGFKNTTEIATKITTIFKLCSRQLSQQIHYDHGLRAIKSVLASATKQKLLSDKTSEQEHVLQALRDVNLPKYISEDINLFQDILSMAFDGPESVVSSESMSLVDALKSSFKQMKLECSDNFLASIQQLNRLLHVRQGVILLGPPDSGKTTAYRVLSSAMASLGKGENKPQIIVINPKALTLHQLYGKFDAVTHEWSDGVLPICYRQLANSTTPNRKWLIFDGPIDSTWVENLNTLLDDNRRLFLMSGENCHLPENMNIIFETDNLQNASPSTVSRCGVMYMSPNTIGWRPLLKCWINTLPETVLEYSELITQLFERFFPPLLGMRRRNTLTSLFPLLESSSVRMAMSLFDCYTSEFSSVESESTGVVNLDTRAQLEGVFFYACIWSIGGSLDAESRVIFDEVFRALLAKEFPDELKQKYNIIENVDPPTKPYIFPIPERLSVYDYRYFREGKGKWRPWEDEVRTAPGIPRDIPVNQIIVPTLETIRCATLLHQIVSHGKPLIFVGPSGVGKTIYISDFLASRIDLNSYKPLFILFSAMTSASEVQELIMSNIDKRRKGVYGPPLGKRCLMFVDDVNLPESKNGSQPSVELLRQLLDHETWYDPTNGNPLKLMDLQLLCAMGPSPNGLQGTSTRFLRHFCALSINEIEDVTLTSIFGRLMLWHLDTRGFSKEFDPSIDELVAATLKVYKECKSFLLPTPEKSHYIFNLRDFSKVIEGVLLSVPEAIEDLTAMKRLWVHEVLRVFGDRLWDSKDRDWLVEVLRETCNSKLGKDMNTMFKHLTTEGSQQVGDFELRKLLFCDFFNPKADSRNYGEVVEQENLKNIIERFSNEYNNMSKKPTNVVIIRFAMEHVSRICRLLKQPRSHALLVGPIGSGRQCLARVAAHISYYELYQPEVTKAYSKTQWRDEIKDLLIKTGTTDQNSVLLFSDIQAKNESFFEDINHLLCLGEIPNLLSVDEKADIIEKVGQIDKQRDKTIQTDGSNAALFNFFLQRLRDQLHIIVCMDPDSNKFHTRLRLFPSLINCCTINWFMPWPEDALQEVAVHMLSDSNLEPNELESCIAICQRFHADAQALSEEAKIKYCIDSVVSPASYIELLSTLRKLLLEKRNSVKGSQEQYEIAVQKILGAERQVPELHVEITELQPKLKESADAVEKGTSAVDNEARDVGEMEQLVATEEEAVAAKRAQVQELEIECEAGITLALPALLEANSILESLPVPEISALRGIKSPPKNLKLVMEAICAIKEIKADKIANPAAVGRTMDDYWGPGKKLLGDSKFIEGLLQIDKDNIPIKASKQIAEKVLTDETFEPEKLRAISPIAEGLCRWVIAIYNYDCAAKIAAPKKQTLADAAENLQTANAALEEKHLELQEAQSRLSDMRSDLVQAQARREQLQAHSQLCQKKLKRSEELLGAVRSQTDHWSEKALQLANCYTTVTGDVIIGAGIIAYLGPYTPNLRERQIARWVNTCVENGLACSAAGKRYSLASVLCDQVEIRDWENSGLPRGDEFCLESAIITRNTGRWPLMIDPDDQANKWIRAIEGPSQLQVVRLTDSDYLRSLENGIQSGKPVLLDNIGEELDSLLEPLLLKQFFHQQGSAFSIKLGESVIEYNPNFRLYLCTRLRKPLYKNSILSKVCLVNFGITQAGLREQVLSLAVARERPDLESEKSQLLTQGAENQRQLRDLENKIIDELSSSEGNILEDETAVQITVTAKTQINEVIEKQNNTEQTEVTIDRSRQSYEPIAVHVSSLYSSVSQLGLIDPMYQFSLNWFSELFTTVIDATERVEDIAKRLQDLAVQFNLSVYRNISLCLFEKDKLLFALLLTFSLDKTHLKREELNFLLLPPKKRIESSTNPYSQWLSQTSWLEICALDNLTTYKGIKEHVATNGSLWEEYMQSSETTAEKCPWSSKLFGLQHVLILKCFRLDLIVTAIYDFVKETLGPEFVNPPTFNLATSFSNSSCRSPLIFIHSNDIDPTASLLKFADDMRVAQKMQILSLGEDQGVVAQRIIEEATKMGSWVLIQNCHLEPNWLPQLEKICDGLGSETTHPEFRLWLASSSSSSFPISILQKGIKMAYDPPTNLRDNIIRSYQSDPVADPDFFETNTKFGSAFRKMIFGLTIFHSLVLERSTYKSIGWNQVYKFSEYDLRASLYQLQCFMSKAEKEMPCKALHYIAGECYYGGFISDPWDQQCLNQMLLPCCGPDIAAGKFTLDNSGCYNVPTSTQYDDHLKHLCKLPLITKPSLCGLNDHLAVNRNIQETNQFLHRIALSQLVRQKSSSSELSILSDKYLKQLPSLFSIDEMTEKIDVKHGMGTLLLQEAQRYNILLSFIRTSLINVSLAEKGITRMSPALEKIAMSIEKGETPLAWKTRSFLSMKSLESYIMDLLSRFKFIQDWYENGVPDTFPISGFYFPVAFITTLQQTFYTLQKEKIIILSDEVLFECEVLKSSDKKSDEGVMIQGLYLNGAKWDFEKWCIGEMEPHSLFNEMPVMQLKPCLQYNENSEGRYHCPVYQTAERGGAVNSAGVHSNFLISLPLPSDKPASHWMLRGVALVCQIP